MMMNNAPAMHDIIMIGGGGFFFLLVLEMKEESEYELILTQATVSLNCVKYYVMQKSL
jgi:peptidase E